MKIKITPRLVLLAGLLGSMAAAWSGFMLGGGPRGSSALPSVRPLDGAEKSPSLTGSGAGPAQPRKTLFSSTPAGGESASSQQPQTFANVANAGAGTGTVTASRTSTLAANKTGSPAPARQRLRVLTAEQETPRYPLVMQTLPADFLNAQPAVAAAVDRLRDKFVAEVGGTGQNPADPAYHARWMQSVSLADEQLRAAVGWQAYNEIAAAAYYAQNAAAQ